MPASPGPQAVPEISVIELKARLDGGDAPIVVDVREAFERDIADLPVEGQMRIPLGELEARTGELDPEGEIVLYCRSGSRSGHATAYLRHLGFARVFNLEGGILAWSDQVDPTMRTY